VIESGDGGFPGTWFIENRSAEAKSQSPQRLTASYMRLLKNLSTAIASRHPSRKILGRLVVSDLSAEADSHSLSSLDEGDVEIVLEIPWSLLFEEPRSQERILSRMLAKQMSTDTRKDLTGPIGRTPSRCEDRRVQFIHCASLFERRERQFTSVPPAAFCMAPALQRNGLQVSVDTLIIEPFAAPGLCPEHVREASREKLDRILEPRPFCIAFTAMDFYLEELRCLLREIRARDRDVVIALGGPLVTLYPGKAPVFLEEGNVFIRGEADLAFSEVLACLGALHAGRDLSHREISPLMDKPGLFLRYGDTVFVSNLDRKERVQDLDEVFSEKVDLGFIEKRHLRGGLHLHTTRGCPFHCSFCAKVHGSHVRAMASETIFRLLSAYRERIEAIRQKEGLSEEEHGRAFQVSLSDDDFLLARSRAKTFFLGVSGHPFRLKTVPAGISSFLSGGGDRARRFDPALSDAIEAARPRIRSFEIGTDDLSGLELSRLAKGHPGGYTVDDIEEVVSHLERLGISNRHFLILSNPDTQWSDLFEKLITLEDLCWSYAHFYPDPNPFVLAPMGTPLFAEMERQGRGDALTKKTFAVPDFPEFTHWVFNMAPPGEGLFSTGRLSHLDFFRRLCDLLKSRCRFSVVDDAYLHFLDVCDDTDPTRARAGEKERVLDQLTRAAHLRGRRIVSGIRDPGFLSVGSDPTGRGSSLAHILSGMLILRETVARVFPEAGFREKRGRLEKTLDALSEKMETGSKLRAGLPAADCRQLEKALRFGRGQVSLYLAGGLTNQASPMADSFVRRIGGELLDKGLHSQAQEWRRLCSQGTDLVRLEVSGDKRDARFIEDGAKVRRLFELLGLVDPGLGHPDEVLRFVRAERVLARSIRDDFLGNTETRVALYDGLAGLPLEFNDRFQQEFCVSPFLNKDEFVAASLSKFLVARKVPHNRAMHGTFLFEGLEDVLQKFVPRSLKELSNWLFERG
jgi:hypothetical protein